MKPTILFETLVVAASGLAALVMFGQLPEKALHAASESSTNRADASIALPVPNLPDATNAVGEPFPTLAARKEMSDAERLRWLEQLGRVPDDANWKDVDLAGRTSWWGRPLDPQKFWKGRVVWFDESAKGEAAAHGRAWPPIPYDDATLARLYPTLVRAYPTDGDTSWGQLGPEGPRVSRGTAMTSRERAFWTEFIRSHPLPPESIRLQQLESAETILTLRRSAENPDARIRVSSEQVARTRDAVVRHGTKMGYPTEAYSDDALFWAYVMSQRQQFQQLTDEARTTGNLQAKALLDRSLVDSKYVTEPLTDEQLKAANAWKITYLQRLRREQVDESYINAYLKTWKLSAAEVFGQGNSP